MIRPNIVRAEAAVPPRQTATRDASQRASAIYNLLTVAQKSTFNDQTEVLRSRGNVSAKKVPLLDM